jgi:uncharacterized protein YutE (UPF0331/DUF86 family)
VTPRSPDPDVVQRRLRMLADTTQQLVDLGAAPEARLRDDPIVRAATERFLQVAVDLAAEINAHLAVSLRERAPRTMRESFLDAAEAGVLTAELATELAPSAGLRNILVHRYTDVRLDVLAEAVVELPPLLREYVRQVARWLQANAS